MTQIITPARECILWLFSSSYNPKQLPKELYVLELEACIYKHSCEIFEDIKTKKETNPSLIFMCYVALFCFGYLELGEDIIDLYQIMNVRIRQMTLVFRKLLPLPHDIGINNPSLLKKWLCENKSKLEWSKPEGRYILNNP